MKMMTEQFDGLKLENQVCFPLYACSKEVVRKYKPYLDAIGLTYTQYITMMVMWEHKSLSVKQIGEYLYLDSGTLTPLLKTLEHKGLIVRKRSEEDERVLIAQITEQGLHLREQAADIPLKMGACLDLTMEEAQQLYQLLYKVLRSL